MSFLKTYRTRRVELENGHAPPAADAPEAPRMRHTPAPPEPAPLTTAERIVEARQRATGVLAAEMDRMEEILLETLRDAEAALRRADAENAELRARIQSLERAHADDERRLRAVREAVARLELG